MTDSTATRALTDRQVKALQTAFMNGKALLALQDEHTQELAVALGAQPLVRVPYSVHGLPNGVYHRNASRPTACGRITSNTVVRLVSEHDASKLLERCKACRW